MNLPGLRREEEGEEGERGKVESAVSTSTEWKELAARGYEAA